MGVLKLKCTSKLPGGLVRQQTPESVPSIPDSGGLGMAPEVGVSNQFPGKADPLAQGPRFENHCFREKKEKQLGKKPGSAVTHKCKVLPGPRG